MRVPYWVRFRLFLGCLWGSTLTTVSSPTQWLLASWGAIWLDSNGGTCPEVSKEEEGEGSVDAMVGEGKDVESCYERVDGIRTKNKSWWFFISV